MYIHSNRESYFILIIMLTLLFGLLSSRLSYRYTNSILTSLKSNFKSCDDDGNHTNVGLLIHMLIFFIIAVGFFYL